MSEAAKLTGAAFVELCRTNMVAFSLATRLQGRKMPPFQRVIAKALQRVADGLCKRLIIMLPPQHGKSELCSRIFPAYYLGKHPDAKIISTGYSFDLVKGFSRDCRDLMRGPVYQSVFPESSISKDAYSVEEWRTAAGGIYAAAGRSGVVAGRPADLILPDDLIANREEAESATMLENAWGFFTDSLLSRAHNDTAIVLVGTRWSVADPIGRVLASEDAHNWEVIRMPAIAEEGDSLGRAVGEALWPERHSAELLASKRAHGEYQFQSVYQQRPYARGGQYVKRDWFKVVNAADVPREMVWHRGLDLAVSAKKSADYTASVRVAKNQSASFVAGGMFRRAEWPIMKRIIVQVALEDRARLHVEAVAGFDVAYRELNEALAGKVRVTRVTATKDKLTRALPWIAEAERGAVHLVKTGEPGADAWIEEFLAQAEAFPGAGAHDDLVDALSIGYEGAAAAPMLFMPRASSQDCPTWEL